MHDTRKLFYIAKHKLMTHFKATFHLRGENYEDDDEN
jgi:hypothetical protein